MRFAPPLASLWLAAVFGGCQRLRVAWTAALVAFFHARFHSNKVECFCRSAPAAGTAKLADVGFSREKLHTFLSDLSNIGTFACELATWQAQGAAGSRVRWRLLRFANDCNVECCPHAMLPP